MIEGAEASDRIVRFGARGSALSLAQASLVEARFRKTFPYLGTEVQVIRTQGDVDVTSPLTEIGGRGVFTSAIEAALVRGDIDAAVHSAKDLPTSLHPEAPIIAFPDRDDPRDVLVSRHGATLDGLPANPVIGTSSRRREVQIRRLRPDARIVNIRGNVDTRLRKARGEELDGVVLAAAGVQRMGWEDQIAEFFPVELMVPSPGQGAIAVQARRGAHCAALLAQIDEPIVSAAVRIERALLAALGAGCAVPVGAYVEEADGGWRLLAMLADAAGERVVHVDENLAYGTAEGEATEIASRLLSDVGVRSAPGARAGLTVDRQDLRGARVVVTRPRHKARDLIRALAERGATVFALPCIRVGPVAKTDQLDAAIGEALAGDVDWIIFTSANAVDAVGSRLVALGVEPRRLAHVDVAAVGPATAAAVKKLGLAPTLVPESASAEALAAGLAHRIFAGQRVFFPRSTISRDLLPDRLGRLGVDVLAVDAYATLPDPDADPAVVARVRQGGVDAMTFASPSSVNGFLDLVGEDRLVSLRIAAICAGPVTAEAAREVGFQRVVVSDDPGVMGVVDAVASFWRTRASRQEPTAPFASRAVAARSAG